MRGVLTGGLIACKENHIPFGKDAGAENRGRSIRGRRRRPIKSVAGRVAGGMGRVTVSKRRRGRRGTNGRPRHSIC